MFLFLQVPEVAASLMPLCEVFGSLKPASSNKSSKDDEPSIYMVFSFAFLYLLRLWKFYRPPLEQCISERGAAVRGELTLEYLLLLRNRSIASCQVETYSNPNQSEPASGKPIYIDSYPKLRAWYCQNKSCIASTLAGLSSGNPVHQVANKILSMIYWKMTKSAASSSNSSTPTSNSACGSPGSTGEDAYQRPVLPAWEVLEAIPFVLEAILTACAHGRLSPRDLTTGQMLTCQPRFNVCVCFPFLVYPSFKFWNIFSGSFICRYQMRVSIEIKSSGTYFAPSHHQHLSYWPLNVCRPKRPSRFSACITCCNC